MPLDGQAPDDSTPAPMPAVKISVCHWANSGHWNQISVSEEALEGHEEHQWDIWPPVPGVTDGQNWGRGENVYVNGCQTTGERPDQTLPTPQPTATVTATATPTSQPTPIPTPEPCTVISGASTAVLSLSLLGTAALLRWRLR